MVLLFYTTNISVDLAHHEIFHAKDGKGGIKSEINSQYYAALYTGSSPIAGLASRCYVIQVKSDNGKLLYSLAVQNNTGCSTVPFYIPTKQ